MRGIGNDSVAGDGGSAAPMVARYEALIRVSEALRAYHDRGTLFRSLARELRPVVQFSFLGLALYHEQTHAVEPYVLERGDFREDLFYRLQVFDIKLPPLRARPTDILPLSEAFLEQIGQTFGRPPSGLTRDAKEALMHYDWPGNVRELRNALERAAILCEGGLITTAHLSLDNGRRGARPPVDASTTDLSAVERDMIAQVLADCSGNKSKAAARLGISRTQLYVRLRRYQLS